MTKRRPDWMKSLSGTTRSDRAQPPVETSEVTRLAEESLAAPAPAPASIQDGRGVKLWDELCARLLEYGTLTPDRLRVLERYVLLNVGMWKGIELGKTPTAALSRELGSLEMRLGLAAPAAGAPPGSARASGFAALRQRAAALDALEANPEAFREHCRATMPKVSKPK